MAAKAMTTGASDGMEERDIETDIDIKIFVYFCLCFGGVGVFDQELGERGRRAMADPGGPRHAALRDRPAPAPRLPRLARGARAVLRALVPLRAAGAHWLR